MAPTPVRHALNAALAVSEAIREVGTIESSKLYSILCGHMTHSAYEALLRTLKRAGLISVQNHVIKWTGPHIPEQEA